MYFVALKLQDPANPSQSSAHPLMTLRLSSPSFFRFRRPQMAENRLYVIDTDNNITKFACPIPKVSSISRVFVGLQNFINRPSVKTRVTLA